MANGSEYSSLPDTPEEDPASARTNPSPQRVLDSGQRKVDLSYNIELITKENVLDEAIKEKSAELKKKREIFEEMKSKEKEMMKVLELKRRVIEAKENKVNLLDEAIKEKEKELEKKTQIFEEMMKSKETEMVKVVQLKRREIEAMENKLRLLDEAIKEKKKKRQIFDEMMKSKEQEMVKVLELKRKEIEVMEEKLSSLDEAIKEKEKELEKKEEVFEAKMKTRVEEMDMKSKYLELKEKRLDEKSIELELKEQGLGVVEGSTQGETSRGSRVKMLAEKGSEANSFIRRKPFTIRENRDDDDDEEEEDNVEIAQLLEEAVEEDVEEEEPEFDLELEPEQITVPDSEFNDFNKRMSTFKVNQIWALYDRLDDMPRYYGKIRGVTKSKTLLVTWVEPKGQEEKPLVPVACGDFEYGLTERQNYLMFSHNMYHRTRRGRNIISLNPKKGETWALFRDWKQSWNDDAELHKPPYRYDFVEILFNFSVQQGVGVAYLGKVEGFVSVFEQAEQHGLVSRVISPEQMSRFSHRVPSVRLRGDENERVPAESFELDPAALPASMFSDV